MITADMLIVSRTALALMAAFSLAPIHVAAAQVAEPDAITKAAMEKRREAEATLASAMGRIGSDRTDATALIDAGRASLALDNPQAALGFLTRAGQLRPNDGTVAALTGAAMVQLERPSEALELFANAARLGAPERMYLSDRGLAQDLLGRQDAAQRDYEAALTQTNDAETVRRYALSLGISGQVDRAIQVLTPQLRTQDRAAWRTRAMVYAIAGRQAEAREIVNATMPGPMAANIIPFLARLPGLTPAQQAAAAHFGALPGGSKPGLPVTPPRPAPGPTPKPAAPPVVIAARPATPTPGPAPTPTIMRMPAPTPGPSAAVPVSTAPPPPVAVAVARPARPAGPSGDLAAVMAGLTVPDSELAASAGALDLAALEAVKAEQRRAAEAETEARKREVAAARVKAEADAKAKAEADKKKAHPARVWVQVATGANASALAGDFGRLTKKYPAQMKGQKAATAEWGRTRRLVVGPFASTKAAATWLAAYKKAGGDGFQWSSSAGEEVTPVR